MYKPYYIRHQGVIWVGLSHEQLNGGQDCGDVERWLPGTLMKECLLLHCSVIHTYNLCHCKRKRRPNLWWYFESIVADSARSVNVGVVNGGQKPYVGGLEWIATREVNNQYNQYV